MSGLALLTALLTPFTRYGFPSGNDLGLGQFLLDAPLNIIPMYAPPRENFTFAEATASEGSRGRGHHRRRRMTFLARHEHCCFD